MIKPKEAIRVFKTHWFAKAAKKALIKDDELCETIKEVLKGQADDLGGGVSRSASTRICTEASFLRVVRSTGFMLICSPKRTEKT